MTSQEIICLTNIQEWYTCCMKSGGAEVPSGGTGAQTVLLNMLKSTSWKIVSMPRRQLVAPLPGSCLLPPVGNAPQGFWSSWEHIPMWLWKYTQPSCLSTTISVTGEVSGTWQWMELTYISWISQVIHLVFGLVLVWIESAGITLSQWCFVTVVMTGTECKNYTFFCLISSPIPYWSGTCIITSSCQIWTRRVTSFSSHAGLLYRQWKVLSIGDKTCPS